MRAKALYRAGSGRVSQRRGVRRQPGMEIAIIGGTGLLGRQVSEELRARGHEVRVVSRGAPKYRADLTTGAGLDEALAGCDAVVDASNNSTKSAGATLVDGTRRLLAASQRAGVPHHVCTSVVGCERIPMGYFQVKAAQEALVAEGTVPWTVVRATQFHEYLAAMLGAGARYGVLSAPRALVQPVASAEVARAVADTVVGEPRQGRVEVAGPEVTGLRDVAVAGRRAVRSRAVLLPLPLPGALGRALRGGAATTAHPDVRGMLTFASWAGQGAAGPPDGARR
jgi:uncharacterized protein YbjT (DUF2867 family)